MTGSGFSDGGQRGESSGTSGALEQIYRLTDAWRECERLLKQAERIGGDAIIPTINQLRYAGTHHVDWLENRDSAALEKAVAHCHRGSYDALEVVLLTNLERAQFVLRELERSYINTSEIQVPGFDEYALRDAVTSLESLVRDRKQDVDARDDETVVKPDLDREYLEQAVARRDSLVRCMLRTPDVLRELRKKENRLRRAEFKAYAGIAVAIVSALAAVIALYNC